MKTRVPALFTAGVLALSLAACGSEEAPEPTEEATEAAAEENGGGGILSLLSSLGENTAEMTNYTLDVQMAAEDPDMGAFNADFTFEVIDDPQAVQTTVVMPEMGEMLLELFTLAGTDNGLTAEDLGTTIMIAPADGETLFSNHNGLQEVDTEWARGAQGDSQSMDPEEMFDLQEFPELAGAFAGIEQIEETGSEEVNGVQTTVVSGTLTQEEVDAMDAASKQAVEDFIGGSIAGTFEVTIWIAEDGFPMRMNLADDDLSMEMEFSEIGTTSFEIPAEDQITDL